MKDNANELQIETLVHSWASAVRKRDIEKIIANHSGDIIMFDVPEPFQSIGIEAYKDTWRAFFEFTEPGVFDIQDLKIFADDKIAFCIATMKCSEKNNSGNFKSLKFRLTIGLIKTGNHWTIVHEHHSVPAT